MKNPHMHTKRPHLRDIRVRNRALLLKQLHKHGAVSRHDLRERTGLTQASISRITRELITEGICFEDHSYHAPLKLGRRQADLRTNPEGGYVIAICLSAFSRMIVVADLAGQNHHHVEIPTSKSKTAVDAIDFVGAYIDDLIAKGSITSNKILGASLSIAGSIDPITGHLAHAPLLNWHDFPITERLEERLPCSLRVENIADTLCLTYLDRLQIDQASKLNIFLVHVAAGMGASLAIDGRIVRRRGDEGWVGNIPVPGTFDLNQGISRLDQISSGYIILSRIEAAKSEPRNIKPVTKHIDFAPRLQTAVEEANRHDGIERKVFIEAGEALGTILMSITSAYLPDAIVLAGPAFLANEFVNGVRRGYNSVTKGSDAETVAIAINRTRYIDAAKYLALHEFFRSGAISLGKLV